MTVSRRFFGAARIAPYVSFYSSGSGAAVCDPDPYVSISIGEHSAACSSICVKFSSGSAACSSICVIFHRGAARIAPYVSNFHRGAARRM
ncbi:MAG TPA: hypothetical protein PLI57_04880 [Spirochaetota bacterium]|nr:hypothetical protein [Spirochaetota bacterium]